MPECSQSPGSKLRIIIVELFAVLLVKVCWNLDNLGYSSIVFLYYWFYLWLMVRLFTKMCAKYYCSCIVIKFASLKCVDVLNFTWHKNLGLHEIAVCSSSNKG